MPDIQVDLSQYLENKKTGAVQIAKLNGVAHYSKAAFDVETGKPKPLLIPLDRDVIAKTLEDRKNDVVIFETLLADMDAATELLAK